MLENEPSFWSQLLNKICAQNTFQCFDFLNINQKLFTKKIKFCKLVCEIAENSSIMLTGN